jgi:hypothetical protein
VASALFVFIQQLTHLVDRERRILPVERFLSFALVQKRTVVCVRASGNFLARLRSIAGAGGSLICVGGLGISRWLLRRSVERAASAVERLGIELAREEVPYSPKTLRIRFFLDVKCSDSCPLVYRSAIRNKLLILGIIVQLHVGPQQPIHQFSFLFLSADTGESSHE